MLKVINIYGYVAIKINEIFARTSVVKTITDLFLEDRPPARPPELPGCQHSAEDHPRPLTADTADTADTAEEEDRARASSGRRRTTEGTGLRAGCR